jgi:hypothetical protein
MIHKSKIIPGLSQFVDNNILSQYPPTSMKRILCAGGIALYLNKGEAFIDALLSNPMISTLGVTTSDGLIEIELLRDTLKKEITKAGYMRVTFPIIGDVDFTVEDVDSLYGYITGGSIPSVPQPYPTKSPEVY